MLHPQCSMFCCMPCKHNHHHRLIAAQWLCLCHWRIIYSYPLHLFPIKIENTNWCKAETVTRRYEATMTCIVNFITITAVHTITEDKGTANCALSMIALATTYLLTCMSMCSLNTTHSPCNLSNGWIVVLIGVTITSTSGTASPAHLHLRFGILTVLEEHAFYCLIIIIDNRRAADENEEAVHI